MVGQKNLFNAFYRIKELNYKAHSVKRNELITIYGGPFLNRSQATQALSIIKNDPVVKGALVTLVDKVLESGWRITGKDKRSRIKALEDKLGKIRFNKVLKKLVFNLILYNNAFVEVVKKGEELTDLNVLENTLMEIETKDNGDIVSYSQDVLTKPTWKPEKILHVKLHEITNNVWAEPLDMEALYETTLIKDYIRQYLMWFFGTTQKRGVYD